MLSLGIIGREKNGNAQQRAGSGRGEPGFES